MTERAGGSDGTLGFELLGWALALASVAYAYAIHQGIGPAPFGLHLAWYEPRGFLHAWGWLGFAFESTPRLLLVLLFPALVLVAAVFIASRSALARALALSSAFAVLLFGFYGSEAARVWELFFWRGSAVLVLTALALGFALAAPLLAASWLRLGWPLRIASYLPAAFVVLAFIRNATGTDPALRYSLSPWPAVSLYGIEVGGFVLMLAYAAAALALLGVLHGAARGRLAQAAGFAAALLAPLLVAFACGATGLLPFRIDARFALALLATSLLASAAALLPVLRRREQIARRAVQLAVGAALLATPILGGQVWARFDYYWTREHRAREIIDAVQRYYDREQLYPDELVQLVDAGELRALPQPAIGFPFLYEGDFRYQSFGTSYLLDFPAPRWVECAYSPPYEDEDEELHPDPSQLAGGGEAGMAEAWSCPKRPPELW